MKTIKKFSLAICFCMSLAFTSAYSQGNPKLSDAEVASVAVVANQIDIEYAEVAKEKSRNSEILQFAETMTNDHKSVLEQVGALLNNLGVTPRDNEVSKKLLADSEKTKKDLLSKSEKDFNKAYIDNEIVYHKAVIAAVEGLLIPETENGELKTLLQNVASALKAHLTHAEIVQKNIK